MAARIAERISVPPGPVHRWALFLDIDGTLLDIAPTPNAVVVPETLPDALARLQAALDGAIALVSGRSLADIDGLFPALAFYAAGQHGAELRLPADQLVRASIEREQLAALTTKIIAQVGKIPGVLVERKGAALAVHYRRMSSAENIIRRILEDATAASDGFEVVGGKMVFEVRPRGVDKGCAIRAFMEHRPFAGRVPIFVGDDVTDRDGMAAVEALGGHAVTVGGEGGGRRFWLPSPEFVRMWLAGLPRAVTRETART